MGARQSGGFRAAAASISRAGTFARQDTSEINRGRNWGAGPTPSSFPRPITPLIVVWAFPCLQCPARSQPSHLHGDLRRCRVIRFAGELNECRTTPALPLKSRTCRTRIAIAAAVSAQAQKSRRRGSPLGREQGQLPEDG